MTTQLNYLDISLTNTWTVWYHKQDEPSWSMDSYIKIFEFSSLLEYTRFKNSFPLLPQYLNGFYFFMLDGVPPQWEHPLNDNGGCFYLPIPKDLTEMSVWMLIEKAITGELLLDKDFVGISVVPKKYNAIVKIWNRDKSMGEIINLKHNISCVKNEEIYYRPHRDNNNYGSLTSV